MSDEWVIRTTLRLPADWRDKVGELMNREGFRNYAEYIRWLIREDLRSKGYLK